MSKYFASLVPDQIMNMVTKFKEATIDVGPQPVKFAKFTQIPWDYVRQILHIDQQQQQQPTRVTD